MTKLNRLQDHEKHHVVPICAGGSNDHTNLVFLTRREHFICHMLLVKFCLPEHLKSLRYALGMMRSRKKYVSSHSYSFAKKQYVLAHIETRLGSRHSEETKQKISKAHLGRKRTPEHCENTRLSQLGKKLSEEHKKKLGDATRGRKITYTITSKQKAPKPKVTCPHCGIIGGKPVLTRFHFDNCKSKSG